MLSEILGKSKHFGAVVAPESLLVAVNVVVSLQRELSSEFLAALRELALKNRVFRNCGFFLHSKVYYRINYIAIYNLRVLTFQNPH